MLTGMIPGLIIYINKSLKGTIKLSNRSLLFTIVLTTLTAYMINSYQMYRWFSWGFLADLPSRTLVMIFKWPLYYFLIKQLYARVFDLVPSNNENKNVNDHYNT
jgi:hypothetical protein